MQQFDLVVIGGGAAGIMSAITAKEQGIDNILLLERENVLGGSLNEYIHNGFGLRTLKEELTGTEFAQRLIDKIEEMKINYKLNAMVLELKEDKTVTYVSNKDGVVEIKAKAIILAMGCRERPRGIKNVPKSRSAGIVPAGSAQKFVNLDGYLPGKEIVVIGSADMGAIISRTLILEGAKVKAVVEHMPYPTACDRNIINCFQSFNIPLMLSHTVVDIRGKDRVEGIVVAEVDSTKKPIPGTEKYVPCDALIFSMGLYPENEITKKVGIEISSVTRGPKVDQYLHTSIDGIFTCGSALHVHNLIDNVVDEAIIAAKSAVKFIKNQHIEGRKIEMHNGFGIKYVVPSYLNFNDSMEDINVFLKVDDIYRDSKIELYIDGNKVLDYGKTRFNPGNIESLMIPRDILMKAKECSNIEVKVSEGKK